MSNGKIKFVAGDGRQSTPRQFAEEVVGKMNEEEFFEEVDNLPEEEICPKPDKKEIVTRRGGMCFHEGADGQPEEEMEEMESETGVLQQNPFRPTPPRPQSAASLAGDIYNKLRILKELYQDLQKFRTSNSNELAQMIEELNIIIFAMGRIYQTLSRSNRLPNQNQRKPRISDFCSGLRTTQAYLRNILFDLRRLQRMVENQNISVQLLIVNMTLMDQQQQLLQMAQYCVYPRQ